MKTTGIVRRVDDLGRIVIPKPIRKEMGLKNGDKIEIHLEDGVMCISKYSQEDRALDMLRQTAKYVCYSDMEMDFKKEILQKLGAAERVFTGEVTTEAEEMLAEEHQ